MHLKRFYSSWLQTLHECLSFCFGLSASETLRQLLKKSGSGVVIVLSRERNFIGMYFLKIFIFYVIMLKTGCMSAVAFCNRLLCDVNDFVQDHNLPLHFLRTLFQSVKYSKYMARINPRIIFPLICRKPMFRSLYLPSHQVS